MLILAFQYAFLRMRFLMLFTHEDTGRCQHRWHSGKGLRVMALGWPPCCCCQREFPWKHHPLCLYTQPFRAYRVDVSAYLSFSLTPLVIPPPTPPGLQSPHTWTQQTFHDSVSTQVLFLFLEVGKEPERKAILYLRCPSLISAGVRVFFLPLGSWIPSHFALSHPFTCVAELQRSCLNSPLCPQGLESSGTSCFFLS